MVLNGNGDGVFTVDRTLTHMSNLVFNHRSWFSKRAGGTLGHGTLYGYFDVRDHEVTLPPLDALPGHFCNGRVFISLRNDEGLKGVHCGVDLSGLVLKEVNNAKNTA